MIEWNSRRRVPPSPVGEERTGDSISVCIPGRGRGMEVNRGR